MRAENIPKISIITPSLNQGKYLEQNIKSVLNQNYKYFEHIIIDGGSTDNTLTIIKKFKHLVWISEKDKGQSDALNKGLRIASGDIIGWLNADDFYTENVFMKIIELFLRNNKSWYIGNIILFEDARSKYIFDKTPDLKNKIFYNPYVVRQPAAFYSRYILEKVGGFDSKFQMVMDYDLWIRLAKVSNPEYIDYYISYFRIHSNQKSQFKNVKIQSLELCKVILREKNYIAFIFVFFTIIRRILIQIKNLILKQF